MIDLRGDTHKKVLQQIVCHVMIFWFEFVISVTKNTIIIDYYWLSNLNYLTTIYKRVGGGEKVEQK